VSILIVDDHPAWRRVVVSMLISRPDLRVVGEAADGFEALRKAEELQPQLILLDMGLPGISGIDVANRIREDSGKSKIIFLSHNNDPVVIRTAISSGGMGYVLKFDAAKQLLSAVTAVLQGHPFVSSGVNYQLNGADSD
jgi:DNA-binding NarL/FixJ family response regulator